MATAKKKPSAKKTPASKAKSTAPKAKPAAATVKKTIKKTSPASTNKASTKKTPIPNGREEKLAAQALELVDQASAILRDRIRTGAQQTAKSRIAAKKKASSLLTKASSTLSKALDAGTEGLQSLLKKI